MSKPVILTGLRANNDLHLGNYLGALLPIVQMQKQHAGDYQKRPCQRRGEYKAPPFILCCSR